MRLLFAFLLHAFHFVYSMILMTRSFWQQRLPNHPQPLLAPRRRIPKHMAILFVTDPTVCTETTQSIVTESVLDAVRWCRTIGIKKLTIYEEKDLLSQCTQNIRDSLPVNRQEADSSESETDYPLTPPPSDYSESRPLSPNYNEGSFVPVTTIHVTESDPPKERQKRQKAVRRRLPQQDEIAPKSDLLLCLVSRESSKPAIASAAQALAQTQSRRPPRNTRSRKGETFTLSADAFDQMLEDEDGLSSPDFMIIHHIDSSCNPSTPLELHGFPPWHIRLTEIYQNQLHLHRSRTWLSSWALHECSPLDENSFRDALDEFASAEMRFGK